MFGRGLEETMAVEARLGGGFVPIFLYRCVTFLRQHGILYAYSVVSLYGLSSSDDVQLCGR